MKMAILFASLLILLVSCGEKTDDILAPSGLSSPIVTGIIVTDVQGNLLGAIGKPNVKLIGNNISNLGIYPNPVDSILRISFDRYKAGLVNIWITPANISEDILTEVTGLNNLMKTNYNVLVFSQMLYAGHHTMEFNLNEYFNRAALSGYYRVYVGTEDELLWDDILSI
ncbi:MAG: hypothetical protein HY840_08900 [Bacteroidetes bacterium]|nr:hypothetical protein [Bacteroidota bacterium]